MPTVKDAQFVHPLAMAVLRRLGGGRDAVLAAIDAATYGGDRGFRGFRDYSDTCGFTRRHRSAIADMVRQNADRLGYGSAVALVKGFECLHWLDHADEAIAMALFGGKQPRDEIMQSVKRVENALALYTLEGVGGALRYADK